MSGRTAGPAQPAGPGNERVYLFALTASPGPGQPWGGSGTAGLDGLTPVELVRHRDVAAVTAAPADGALALLDRLDPDDLTEDGALARLARRHDVAVRAAALAGPVLPLRFGTVIASPAAVAGLLASRYGDILAGLGRVRGCQEWGVRVRESAPSPQPPVHQPPVHQPPAPASRSGPGSGTAYLLTRRQVLADGRARASSARAATAGMHEALTAYSVQTALRTVASGTGRLLDGAYLVRESGEPAFRAAVGRAASDLERLSLVTELTGPWPPYTFGTLP